MAKVNERGAGRKPKFTEEQIHEIQAKRSLGVKVSELAKEYGVSRQTLSAYLNPKDQYMEQMIESLNIWREYNRKFCVKNPVEYTVRMDFMCEEECCTQILVDFKRERIAIINTTEDIVHRAFGIKAKPTWEDFMEFLEERCFPRTRAHMRLILEDLGLDFYDPVAIVEKTKGRMAEDLQWIKITYLQPTI